MAENQAPDPYVQAIPEQILHCLRYMLLISSTAVRALWRPLPQLTPIVAEVETLTGLTEADLKTLTECAESLNLTAREAVLRPARLYTFIALGMALYESPLSNSPFIPSLDALDSREMARRGAQLVFEMIEDTPGGEVHNYPSGFEFPLTEAAAPTQEPQLEQAADETSEELEVQVEVYPVEDLRLMRLQLESLIEQAAPQLSTVIEIDQIRLPVSADQSPDQADDPAFHDFYHTPCMTLGIRPAIRALTIMSLAAGAYWHLDAMVAFARAAAGLRWLRRHEAVLTLQDRLLALTYESEEDLTESISVAFSLAELLTMYQAMESLALAVLNDAIMPAIQAANEHAGKGLGNANYMQWFQPGGDDDGRLGDLFFRNVPVFAEILTERLEGEQAQAFAAARTEIAALAELATSPDAV